MDMHGALVGWTYQDLGSRIMLNLESVASTDAARDHQPDILRILLTKQQAALLGNFLGDVSGATPPTARERGWLKRLFG